MNIFSLLIVLFSLETSTFAIVLPCTFGKFDGSNYACKINDPLVITSSSDRTITSYTGTHLAGYTNADVIHLLIFGKTVNYFPLGIGGFFPNLFLVSIAGSQLKEIHASDLTQFTKVLSFQFINNPITVLEAGLFDGNQILQQLVFVNCNITCVDPHVFDKLIGLSFVDFSSNVCANVRGTDATSAAAAVQTIKSNCTCAPPISPCEAAEQAQTAQLTSTINNLQSSLTNTINQATAGLCTASSINTLNNNIAALRASIDTILQRIYNLEYYCRKDCGNKPLKRY